MKLLSKLLILFLLLSITTTSYSFWGGCSETKAGQRLIKYIQELKTSCKNREVETRLCSLEASIRIQSYIGIATEEEIREAEILASDLP